LRGDSSGTSRTRCKNTTPSVRVVGVDDGAFRANKRVQQRTLLAAVLFRGLHVDALRLGRIEVDGRDANEVLVSLLRSLRFDAVMLSGISFGGFNLVNIAQLAKAARRPVIAVAGERPDNSAVRKALRMHFSDWPDRWEMVRAAGRLYSFRPLPEEPRLYFEVKGTSPAVAKKIIGSMSMISRLPEPIRVAGILARGLSAILSLGAH